MKLLLPLIALKAALSTTSDLQIVNGNVPSCCKGDSTLPAGTMQDTSKQVLNHTVKPCTMKMFFHFSYADYLLFDFWIPTTLFQYIFALLACFLLSVFFEALQTKKSILEHSWKPREIKILGAYSVEQFKIDVIRSCFQFVILTIGYCLMLITMNFNVGMFLAIMVGLTFGSFIFARLRPHSDSIDVCVCWVQ